jgi:hypothetical protein
LLVAPDGTVITFTATPARQGLARVEKIQREVTRFVLSINGDQKRMDLSDGKHGVLGRPGGSGEMI